MCVCVCADECMTCDVWMCDRVRLSEIAIYPGHKFCGSRGWCVWWPKPIFLLINYSRVNVVVPTTSARPFFRAVTRRRTALLRKADTVQMAVRLRHVDHPRGHSGRRPTLSRSSHSSWVAGGWRTLCAATVFCCCFLSGNCQRVASVHC